MLPESVKTSVQDVMQHAAVPMQARGITMKSSSISLLYVPDAAYLPEGPQSCTQEDKLRKGRPLLQQNAGNLI